MAKRSHPPSLLRSSQRVIRDHAMFGRGDRIVCAVSGGPDSMAMLHVLARHRDRIGHELFAVGVDHGLRPDARQELNKVAALAAELGVDFHPVTLSIRSGANLQARARSGRHRALQREAHRLDAHCIALGHTADDRAETFIMRLLRGAGPKGLAVMPHRAKGIEGEISLVRPLLDARRNDVVAHVKRHQLDVAHDPSNLDRRFLRVRVRREVMPLLEELAPQLVEQLGALADGLDTDNDVLEGLGRHQRKMVTQTLRAGLCGNKTAQATIRLAGGRELSLAIRKTEQENDR